MFEPDDIDAPDIFGDLGRDAMRSSDRLRCSCSRRSCCSSLRSAACPTRRRRVPPLRPRPRSRWTSSRSCGRSATRPASPGRSSPPRLLRHVGRFPLHVRRRQPHQMERVKAAMVNALVGRAIVLMARVIAGMIQSSLGSGATGGP